MAYDSSYKMLEKWLVTHGRDQIAWTTFTQIELIDEASAALADLNSMMESATEEEIILYFKRVRRHMREGRKDCDGQKMQHYCSRYWPAETD